MNTNKDTAERIRARLERKRSGAAGTHADRRTRRRKTRATRKHAALAEYR